MKNRIYRQWFLIGWGLAFIMMISAGCAAPMDVNASTPTPMPENDHHDEAMHTTEALPELTPVALTEGEKLRVVATTNIVGDVVHQVGGDAIELVQLLAPGADPHSYQARPDDLRALNQAQVIFINGLHLEEAMSPVLENLDSGAPVVAVNIGVTPLEIQEEPAEVGAEAHHHEGADPHTWMDVRNVEQWVANIAAVLTALDPAHAEVFAANAAAYTAKLAALDQEIKTALAAIPVAQRKVVTDHDNLGYLANAYGLTIVGAVIPSLSTMAAPSAQELAALQQQIAKEGVKAILVGNTVNPNVAQQLARDTGAAVTTIYTDSLSSAEGPAATYIDMMRYNLKQIVAALTAQ
ncbi:MAG TPA: zinc ABC transporter substrate-binding protein [Chloroflexi bacterium]|nr:zinc ABC transporter substrate-binding protein [Chloroflexota bacterium]